MIDQLEYREVLGIMKQEARGNLLAYTCACDPFYNESPVHSFVGRKLQAVAEGKIKRLILAMPPRHGKSRLTAVELTTWILGKNPRAKIITASFSGALSKKHSKEARARLLHPFYQETFPTRLHPFDRAAERWATTDGGEYQAVGIHGTLTGLGADYLIIDDPLKDHQEANSFATREKVWQWYISTAYTRLMPDAAIIVIMTRWHVDDLVGRLLDPNRVKELAEAGLTGETWEVVSLPAIAKDNDPMGRQVGEALDPVRYPIDALRGKRIVMDRFNWSALYEQNPVPAGGRYINGEYIRIVSPEDVPKNQRWFRFWDLAATVKKESDWTVGLKGCLIGDTLYLADEIRGQWAWPQARAKIMQAAAAERIPVGIEVVGQSVTTYDDLQDLIGEWCVVRKLTPETDKLTRALPWIPKVENRKVCLVRGDWNIDFINELEAFPRGTHDDRVDAVSGLWIMIDTMGGTAVAVPQPGHHEGARAFRGRARDIRAL